LHHAEIKKQFISLFSLFTDITTKLRQDEDFLISEINNIQISMDIFSILYVDLFGHSALTNYIHMFRSGHMRELILGNNNGLIGIGSIHRESNIALEVSVAYNNK